MTEQINWTNGQPMGVHPEFGALLRRARVAAKLSMRALAVEVGVSTTYISHLEAGRARPALAMTRRLARACLADEDEFIILARYLPGDVAAILYEHPKQAVAMLRESFVGYGRGRE